MALAAILLSFRDKILSGISSKQIEEKESGDQNERQSEQDCQQSINQDCISSSKSCMDGGERSMGGTLWVVRRSTR